MSEATQDSYNFKSLFSLNGEDKTNMNIGEFKGNLYLTVFDNGKKSVGITLDRYKYEGIRRQLVDIQKAAPGTKKHIVVQKWDQDAKKANPITYFAVGKTDEDTFYIEIKDKEADCSYIFPFKTPISFDMAESMSKADRSLFGLQVFLDFWNKFYSQVTLLSRFNYEPPQRNSGGNNRGGGGGRSSGGSSGGGSEELTF